jgi:hypothetical protein
MAGSSRRTRCEFDGVFLLLCRVVSEAGPNGWRVADAIGKAEGNCGEAAGLMRIPEGTMRMRLVTLRNKFEAGIPGLEFGRGRVGREVSVDASEGFAGVLGL